MSSNLPIDNRVTIPSEGGKPMEYGWTWLEGGHGELTYAIYAIIAFAAFSAWFYEYGGLKELIVFLQEHLHR